MYAFCSAWHDGVWSQLADFETLLSKPDRLTWVQVLLGQAANDGQCPPPPVAQPGNGVCDQFGTKCRMWECPDAFDMGNGTWAFKWSDQVSHLPYLVSAIWHIPE